MMASPFSVRAQQPQTLLAILSPARHDSDVLKNVNDPFKQALAKLGWAPGRNVTIVERFADGDDSRLPALAVELISLKPRAFHQHGEPLGRPEMFVNGSLAAELDGNKGPVSGRIVCRN
jgi:hypothetical protein